LTIIEKGPLSKGHPSSAKDYAIPTTGKFNGIAYEFRSHYNTDRIENPKVHQLSTDNIYVLNIDGKRIDIDATLQNLKDQLQSGESITSLSMVFTTKNTIITQPGAPLKAFAAVSQLIGCGTGANKDKAEVRITNVSGGPAPYQYKFSGNYSNLNSGWLSAGTHTVYVKDANGCELGMTVAVTAKIPEPTGTTYTITGYDCNGNATVRFMGLPTSYNYTYEIGGKTATGTTATITGLAPGNYTVTIKYKNANPPAASILIQDDFGIGEDACSANVAPAIQCGPGMVPTPGRYVIGSNSSLFVQSHLTYWSNANDHTNPANNKSRMLMIDIGNVGNGDVLYQKTVNII